MNKTKVFQFKKGQCWDGDNEIVNYIEDVLLDEREVGDFPTVKEKTYITLHIHTLRKK